MKSKTMLKAAASLCLVAVISYYSFWTYIYDQDGREVQDLKSRSTLGDGQHQKSVPASPEKTVDHHNQEDQKSRKDIPVKESVRPTLKPVFEGSIPANRNFLHLSNAVHLSLVACGDRLDESIVLLKSAVLLTHRPLVLHLFVDDILQQRFRDQLEFWPKEFKSKIYYRIFPITYPSGQNSNEWRKLFKPCASQRLFIAPLLADVDAILYVDTDILFLSSIEGIWKHFNNFTALQSTGLAPEHEDYATGWYNRFARHPYYEPLGVNSGVMLMNLTRLRHLNWQPKIFEYYKTYKYQIVYGDQDLINIYFHFHADELYIFPCHLNYRPDHCMYMSVCKSAEQKGAAIIHGCRRSMHTDKHPAFKAIYQTFYQHRLGADLRYSLLDTLKRELDNVASTKCGQVRYIFLKWIEKEILNSPKENEHQ